MSQELINHNSDIHKLWDEGYQIEVKNGFLLIKHIPYLNFRGEVLYGTLVSRLELAGNRTIKPRDHVAWWIGEFPYNSIGQKMTNLVNQTFQQPITDGLIATVSFSQKPQGGYIDYYQKMTTYISILEGEAKAVNGEASAKVFPVLPITEEDTVFRYIDTSSSRTGVADINEKLKTNKIAIIGLGGTGAYILDLVSKTSVEEIHLFDGDVYLQHNAFRSPGPTSIDDLREKIPKVEFYAKSYSKMRRGVISHAIFLNENNTVYLENMNFVFLSLTDGKSKKLICDFLLEHKIPFIDVGMGLERTGDRLDGLIRVTTITPTFFDHLNKRISFSDGENEYYSSNIQTADTNALNAALAVIKWKKIIGFYLDTECEYNSVYGISTNLLTNDERTIDEN